MPASPVGVDTAQLWRPRGARSQLGHSWAVGPWSASVSSSMKWAGATGAHQGQCEPRLTQYLVRSTPWVRYQGTVSRPGGTLPLPTLTWGPSHEASPKALWFQPLLVGAQLSGSSNTLSVEIEIFSRVLSPLDVPVALPGLPDHCHYLASSPTKPHAHHCCQTLYFGEVKNWKPD